MLLPECHPATRHDTLPEKNLARRTTYDEKNTPLILGAQFSFWSIFIDFELMSNIFVAQKKASRQIVCFSGWLVKIIKYHLLSLIHY